MRYAILSDIHGNLEALEAVLKHMKDQGIDRIVCLGDTIDYGPNPKDCLEKIESGIQLMQVEIREPRSERCASAYIKPILKGNHEEQKYHKLEIAQWTRRQLPDEVRTRLRALPFAMRIDPKQYNGKREILLTHGEWTAPHKFKYLYPYVEDGLLRANVANMEERDILCCGHTHIPAIFNRERWEIPPPDQEESEYLLQGDGKVIVNVGSVGQPRMQSDDRATYVTYDTTTDRVTFHRVKYEYGITREKIMAIEEVSKGTREKLALSLGPYK